MKKIKIFGLASTLILAGAAGFTSCSSDSADPIGGGTGVAGQVVKTQFAINIPYGGGGTSSNLAKQGTRMTEATAQQQSTPAFRGISDILLLTFKGDPTSTINADKPIDIGDGANAYDKDNYRRLYRDIPIKLDTDHMLFYGRATKKESDSKFDVGDIIYPTTYKTITDLANMEFELSPINNTEEFNNNTDAKKILTALNNVANTSYNDGTTTFYWKNIGNTPTGTISWMTESERKFLQDRYDKFITLTAGSKTSVKAILTDLQNVLKGEDGKANLTNKHLAKEIYDNCTNELSNINTIDFPGKLDLPDGAAKVTWNKNAFSYVSAAETAIKNSDVINYNKICYPAELSYFVNTATMVSDKDISTVESFPKYEDWTKDPTSAWSNTGGIFTEGAVKISTKTVALKLPIQYSVAVLKTTIKCNTNTLKDNATVAGKAETDQDIDVTDTSFPVTAILVGGQPGKVDWKYEPKTGENFAHTIYDNVMNGGSIYAKHESTASNQNYTIVFDNKNATGTENPVYVTVELENKSGQAFYGANGIIPKDSKFYLIGKLDPTGATGTATSGVAKPTTGSTINRVFLQDHVTTANFTIMNLKNAYNYIPDLRSSGFNVGLAVDLKWEEGITFNVEL